jgi:hypothetical protein
MRSFSTLVALGAAIGLLAVPAAMAGSDAGPPKYPSIVNKPMVRTTAALNRALKQADKDQPDKAAQALNIARAQLKKAWAGEKYLIDNAPPPVVGDAYIDGNPGTPGAYADAPTTGGAVLALEHDAVATAGALLGTKNVALRNSARATIASAQTQRDALVQYAYKSSPPPPPAGAGAIISDAPAGSPWSPIMQAAIPDLDDEIQYFTATLLGDQSISPLTRTAFTNARTRAKNTETTINQLFPPVVGDG